jgi:hypothetical protein
MSQRDGMRKMKPSSSSFLKQYTPLHAWEKNMMKLNNVNNVLVKSDSSNRIKLTARRPNNNQSVTKKPPRKNDSKTDSIGMSISSVLSIPNSGTF